MRGEENQLTTFLSRHAHMQHSGEVHQLIQGSIHRRTLREGPRLPNTKLGLITQAIGDHDKPNTLVKV